MPKPAAGPVLTPEQAAALTGIESELGEFGCHLLDGITGSGKTEIYLRLAANVLAQGRQVLILVPEIGLTPQLLRRFRERLGIEPVVSHSAVAAGERLKAWAAALRGEARLLIGTRSALFLPLDNPGLIVMDESHDASFKQQDGFRYSARDVAVKRAHELGIPVVLGTATPSLESLNNAITRSLPAPPASRAGDRSLAAGVAGCRSAPAADRRRPEQPALEAIDETLGRGEQVLVFLNRRGYAPVLLCHECGWHGGCSHCDANLTWHRSRRPSALSSLRGAGTGAKILPGMPGRCTAKCGAGHGAARVFSCRALCRYPAAACGPGQCATQGRAGGRH